MERATDGSVLSALAVGPVSRAAMEVWYRRVLALVDQPVALAWPDGRVLHLNPAFRAALRRRGAGPPPARCMLADVARWSPSQTGAGPEPDVPGAPAQLPGRLVPLVGTGGRVVLTGFIGRTRRTRGADGPPEAERSAPELGSAWWPAPGPGVRGALPEAEAEVVGRLAAGAAHEIRNPLTAIAGLVQLLAPLVADETGTRYLDIIREEIARLEGIASDLLLLGRPRPEAPATARASDVGACLRFVAALVQGQAAALGIGVGVSVDPALPPAAIEAPRLQQVVLNLVTNALEAIGAAGNVDMSARCRGSWVEIVVADDGPGIPADDVWRIFDPFFTTKAGGTGLGLAVSQGIVRRCGGQIRVESARGAGATFRIELPVAEQPAGT